LAIPILIVVAARAGNVSKVRVTGQRVNLRAKADLNAEVVGQMSDGDILTAKSFPGEWVEVVPPPGIDLWVHGDFIRDNRVAAKKLHVRGGPGINYSVVGELHRGDTIVRRGDFGEWLKIEPPSGSSLWVNRALVELLQPEKPKMPAVSTAAKSRVSVKKSASSDSVVVSRASARTQAEHKTAGSDEVEAPDGLKLIPLAGQGKQVQREGVLRIVGFIIGRPSRYRLVRQRGTRFETICYVRGNSRQLRSFVGQKLLIRGREYWVKGVDYPVVIPDQIVPMASRHQFR